jgi:hypothetical protein
MQNAAAAPGEAAIDGRCVSLCKLGLEMLVDQEQRPHGTAQVTVATRDDLVDCSVVRSQTHRKSSGSNQDNLPVVPAFLWIARMIGAHSRLDGGTDRGDYKEAAMTSA